MKTRWGIYGLLVTMLLQLSVFAGTVLAYDISGTVEYAGAKTGRIFITVPQTQIGTLGTSVVFDGTATSVPYTIRGVPSGYPNGVPNGSYTISAFLDPIGKGVLHASAPTGGANVTVNSNVTGVTIALTEPAIPPSPDEALPVDVSVLHGSGADMLTWSTSSNQDGPVPADSYNLYWSTDADVMGTYSTSGGSRTIIPASDDNNVFFNTGIASTYYYVMKSVVNGTESSLYTSASSTAVGTGSTISGVVALSGGNPAGKQLAVVIGSDDGGPTNFIVLTTSGATQSFSITGVPDGDYWIYPVFDMNGNGLLDEGDIWPGDDGAGYAHVAGGDVDAGTIAFGQSNVNASVTTNYWKNNWSTGYGLNFELRGNMKDLVNATFTGGTGMPDMVVDVGLSNWGGFDLWTNISWTPQVGDAYTFDVTYADNSTETVTGYVTGVLDSLPMPISPVSAIPYGAGTPTFSWDAPSSPPADYTYSLSLWGNDYNVWWSPDNDLPGTQLSAEYNYDNSASQSALPDGQTYWWRIAVNDSNGNSASHEAGFTYAGAIAGVVQDYWDGVGIPNVYVSVCQYDSGTGICTWGYNGTSTDANGNYTLVGLPAGEYKVRFNAADAGYVSGWYNDATDENSAEPVSVSMGYETAYIDAWLLQGGSISGTVTDGTSGIQNVNVQVCQYDSGTNNCIGNFNSVNTDTDGSYTVGGLPAGDYKVQFNASSLGYISEWYNDTTDMNAAALQTVDEGATVTGIDAVLAQGGSISGRVTTNGTTGIQNVNVQVCQHDSGTNNCYWGFNGTNTDATGNYTLGGLPAGQYKVQFNGSNQGYINEWFNNTTDMNAAAPQTVTVGATVTDINAVLSPGGSISGRVTNGTSGLSNIGVSVYATNNSYSSIGWTNTDLNGNYTLPGLATGTYKVYFDAGQSGYASRWYNNKADFNAALSVSVAAPSPTPLEDVVLVQGVYYTLTASAGMNGSINPSGTVQVLSGDSRELSVTAYPPYVIDSVSGTCGGTLLDSTYTTNAITQDCSVTVATKLASYPLTVNTAGTGSGNVTGEGTYDYGTLQMVTATPIDANSTFAGWSGDCGGLEPNVSVYMNGPKTCTATFNAVAQPDPAKIGVFSDGYWYLDTNQSWAWDGTPTDSLGIFGLGIVGAIPVAGDWNSDGKSEIGVYIDGIWYLDMNGNGQWDGEETDVRGVFGLGVPNAKPVIGDWTGDGKTKIGIYADGIWYLDANQTWAWEGEGEGADIRGVFGVGLPNAKPVTGDWNSDGITEIGVYSEGNWYLDNNSNWAWDGVPTDIYGVFGVGLPNVVPVTGDWNGDGITKIGVYSDGNWYLDKNNSWDWNGEPIDTYGAFGTGLPNVVPVVGNW